MELFAVVGKPVLHNKNPQIWNHAFECLGISAHYFRINPIDAEKAVSAIRELQLSGCSVASPFERDILEYLDKTDESARFLGAVNTIKNKNGSLIGFNTDSHAVVNSLKESGLDLKGKKVVVLGVKGSARAAVYGLLQTKARDVVILDRAYEKAIKIAEQLGCRVAYFGRVKSEIERADILISCVSSNKTIAKKEWLHTGLAVFDTTDSSGSTLIEDARDAGCQIISNLNWLVHQTAPAFELFFKTAPTELMKEIVYNPVKNVTESVAIIGFMGVGKTIVGRHLARMTGKEFVDTDRLIVEKAGENIPEIFKKYGESGFREMERSVFEQLDLASGKIFSCGGGAVKDTNIRTLLRKHCTVIWLWSSLSTTLSRITKGTRPLLETGDIEEKARKIFSERIQLYADCTDLMIVNETVSTWNIAKKIYGEIYKTNKY